MNVYFVNRYSKLKGPFDIIDSNRQHIIKVGDICLRDTNEGITFLVVYSSVNTWNACKLVGIGEHDTLSDIGNTLLFSFDGLRKRRGDIKLIKQILLCYREKVIDDFFNNAVDILEYKKDFWDGSLFPQFFASTQEIIEREERKKTDVSIDTNFCPSYFAQYLTKDLQKLLITSLDEGNDLKEAYLILRKKHPELFRKALMRFLIEHPNGNIYDKPADVYVPTVREVEKPKKITRDEIILESDERIDEEFSETNKRIELFLSEIGRQELLSVEDEIELAAKIRKGEIDARNKLVSANLRIVIGLAKQYLYKGLDFEDLLQEGFLGLIKATELFDETRGIAFAHYAPWWIKRYLTDAVINNSSLIRFPFNVQILHKRVWDSKLRYERENGYLPPITEIDVPGEEDLERISFLNSLPNPLRNTCIPFEDLDVIEDAHNDIWDYEDNEYYKYYIRGLLDRLSEREKFILTRVYGIGVNEETLETIGYSRGLTRERVRQIKEEAIKKLREMIYFNPADNPRNEIQGAWNENSFGQSVIPKRIEDTQTLREVQKVFSQTGSNIVKFTEVNKRRPVDNENVILSSEKLIKTSGKVEYLDTCIYTVINNSGKCNIYDQKKRLVYSSTGSVKVINNSYYRMSLTFSFFSIWLLRKNLNGDLFNAKKIVLANNQTKLYRKLHRKEYFEMIEDIKHDGRKKVKVDGRWFDEQGNEVSIETYSNSNNIELNEIAGGYGEDNNIRNPRIPVDIDENEIEHVYVGISSAEPYIEVEVDDNSEEEINEVEETEVVIEPKILSSVFDKKATSYKYFWFLSLISLAKEADSLIVSYKDIVIRMAALAWPLVMDAGIDLGNIDMMSKYLSEVSKKTKLIKAASSNVVETYMRQHYSSQGIEQILAPLLKNVPYRFLSPWIPFTTTEEVIAKSKSSAFPGLYALHDEVVVINKKWWDYISQNYVDLCDFAKKSFITYAKQYNNQMKLLGLMSQRWSLIKT